MPQIEIPHDLFEQIQAALPVSTSPEQFVSEAVREKLAERDEFMRLSDITRQAMVDRGLSEEEILADFDSQRR